MSALESYLPLVQVVLFVAGWTAAMVTGIMFGQFR